MRKRSGTKELLGKKVNVQKLLARAKELSTGNNQIAWHVNHPLRTQIAECLIAGVSPTGLSRALKEEGHVVSPERLVRFRRHLKAEG